MSRKKARFTVDEQGRATDQESFQERMKAWTSEVSERLQKERNFKQAKHGGKAGAGLLGLGLLSLEASKTPDLLWSFLWGLLAVILFLIGGFLAIASFIELLRGSR